MHILTTLTPISAPRGSAVALGFFDGVHLGHRAVLTAAVDYAAAHGLTAAAFTFLLPPDHPMKGGRIFPEREKHRRVAELGIQEYQEAPLCRFLRPLSGRFRGQGAGGLLCGPGGVLR